MSRHHAKVSAASASALSSKSMYSTMNKSIRWCSKAEVFCNADIQRKASSTSLLPLRCRTLRSPALLHPCSLHFMPCTSSPCCNASRSPSSGRAPSSWSYQRLCRPWNSVICLESKAPSKTYCEIDTPRCPWARSVPKNSQPAAKKCAPFLPWQSPLGAWKSIPSSEPPPTVRHRMNARSRANS